MVARGIPQCAGANPAPWISGVEAAPERLARWDFNGSIWGGDRGQWPLSHSNVWVVPGVDGTALRLHHARPALLSYREAESDGRLNLAFGAGSVRFWFRPDWSSATAGGAGPGAPGMFLEAGVWSPPPPRYGWWGFYVNGQGTELGFAAQTNGAGATFLTHPIRWVSNQWHEITLAYSPRMTALYVDGRRVAQGSGVSVYPGPATRAGGFFVGCGRAGDGQVRGTLDELETFNYPLGPAEAWASREALSAEAQTDPPAVMLRWQAAPNEPMPIRRRAWGETNWVDLRSGPGGWSRRDTNGVALGGRYEYWVGDRYLLAGVRAVPVEHRGGILLVVDETVAGDLRAELERLREDLVGDGWTVTRFDAPRHDDANWGGNPSRIEKIRDWVKAASDGGRGDTRAIYIVGHVAIPYAGPINPDGHGARLWPVDGVYGLVSRPELWTDKAEVRASQPPNLPGDGRFDQGRYPAALDLVVGRVDFAGLEVFRRNTPRGVAPASEPDLLRRYLDKAHRYRHGGIQFEERAVVAGYFMGAMEVVNENLYRLAQRHASRCFGGEADRVREGDVFAAGTPVVWGLQGGYSSVDTLNCCGHPHSHAAAHLADPAREPGAAFLMVDGSYFGDWNTPDNFLRACLATPNRGLGIIWARNPAVRLEAMGLGEPVATGLRRTMNEPTSFGATASLFLAWLGDPTLRLEVIAPPSRVQARRTGSGVSLEWDAASEPGASYWVYRSRNGLDGPFERLNTEALAGTRFVDAGAPEGPKLYQVRAAALRVTGSGSFTNLSQGVFARLDR